MNKLTIVTDAHCHPTDLSHLPEVYDNVPLGGIASMATTPEDQEKVYALGAERGWRQGSLGEGVKPGVKAVSCFGYHPWFSHRYTLTQPPPTKSAHYNSVFFPPSPSPDSSRRVREKEMLKALLPFLPEPLPFGPLLDGMRRDIRRCKGEGRLVMVGEVGLDGAARVLWPVAGRRLYDETTRTLRADYVERAEGMEQGEGEVGTGAVSRGDTSEGGKGGRDQDNEEAHDVSAPEGEEWKRLSPFKISMDHQKAILRAQMDIAVEFGIPISLHCVAAPGHTIDSLRAMRDTHGARFTNRVNVDLHSGGGWTYQSWLQASKPLSNLYASPSIFITGRLTSPDTLIASIASNRLLVESDSHDVRLSSRLVWAAAVWISRVKGWKLEGKDGEDEWGSEEVVESEEEWVRRSGRKGANKPEEVWTVRTLERNWARFMGLIEPYE